MNFFQRLTLRLLRRRPEDYLTTAEVHQRLEALSTGQPSEEELRAYAEWRATNPSPPTPDDPQPWRKFIRQKPSQSVFVFTEDETGRKAFFTLQCKYGDNKIEPNKGIVAMVLDAEREFDAPTPVKVEADGKQTAVLRVASRDGGFVVLAKTSGRGELLRPGDFVIWVPRNYSNDVAETSNDARFGWVGSIPAKIKTQGPPFENICRYR
ncbi:hypothetical protein [Rhodoblastus sp.]|jgi:hypothetical protein|uniref:hypothetical protein n=1 Tax=Rhodoblastus sp. TaxID=1962975 RepID=UPI0025DD9403|nr:hypothetical protein [Rhodoblastus sp.]